MAWNPARRSFIEHARGNEVAPQCEGSHDATRLCERCDNPLTQCPACTDDSLTEYFCLHCESWLCWWCLVAEDHMGNVRPSRAPAMRLEMKLEQNKEDDDG